MVWLAAWFWRHGVSGQLSGVTLCDRAPSPQGYFFLLRALFRALSGGAFERSYAELQVGRVLFSHVCLLGDTFFIDHTSRTLRLTTRP